jgi:hypothetical protein
VRENGILKRVLAFAGYSKPIQMDGKVVNREIRKRIWPKLKEAGFTAFTPRTAWRYGEESIDVFNFRSFNKYHSDVMGITTFSFSVNLGRHLSYIPPTWPHKVKDGRPIPSEPECEFRGSLIRSIPQSKNNHVQMWAIDKRGENLDLCMADVERQIPLVLDWYARLSDREEVLRILLENPEQMLDGPEPIGYWGFGRNPSPIRSYLAGYSALNLGNDDLAREKFFEAVQSGCFSKLFTTVEEAISRVSQTSTLSVGEA